MNNDDIQYVNEPIIVSADNKKRVVVETEEIWYEFVVKNNKTEKEAFDQIMMFVEIEILNQFKELTQIEIDKAKLKEQIDEGDIPKEAFEHHLRKDE